MVVLGAFAKLSVKPVAQKSAQDPDIKGKN